MNQLSENVNRMTQSMMERMMPRVETRPSVLTDNTLNANAMPVNVVLRQGNPQQSLSVPEPTQPQQPPTILVVPVGHNRHWGNTLTETVLPQMTRNGVNIVMVERNETSGSNQPTVTKTTTTRISDPSKLKNSSIDSIFSQIRAPGTVSSFISGAPDANGKDMFNGEPLVGGNTGNVVSIPGSASFMVLDGNQINPNMLSMAGNAMPVVPGVDIVNTGSGRPNVLGPDALPFGGGFPTRQRGRERKRKHRPQTSASKPVSQAEKPKVSQAVPRAQEAQKRKSDVGVPINPDFIRTMNTSPAQTGGVASTARSSLVYSQDTVISSNNFHNTFVSLIVSFRFIIYPCTKWQMG